MQPINKEYDVIIVGAGAAGLICAVEAGKRKLKVLLIEQAKSVGNKIRISGGGRCNFTNINASPANYISKNQRFCISALKSYTQHDFIALVEKHGIKYHEKTLGQLFCDTSSKQIIDMLLSECNNAGVNILLNNCVNDIRNDIRKENDKFQIKLKDGYIYSCRSLVIATGGPSIPKMGSSTWGHKVAEKFGHSIVELRAGLVPFLINDEELKKLAGVSVEVIAACNNVQFKEAMLFTHRGLSGPAILQISSYRNQGERIILNLYPNADLFEQLKTWRDISPKQDINNCLGKILPKRVVQYICTANNYKGNLAELPNKTLKQISDSIQKWEIIPDGTEGYRTAEVTIGGVNTDELSSKTMESKKVSGLYFIGEVVDVTGHLGGYNFQWAWSSGYVAGQYV
ncbi:MAG: NAD(P)/FAD-dependent oxidoreductase [Rickettsiales bacterium]|nr:NAD(P)/FAD-dependent oxidoreductase [Pseudomonadota bacterium]MDA0966754.1 NAD(P)/FAD-dependent oxidoreductase [Pseudomonadota bacterium]MDG4543426.1 NAD(P)/FAD-dependent oxidoreductase [Rickettsiales bacterium]MDG4546180.1 NAD(P)/FAD-dependent oxidoreductase [Rickettsiales bacterium]MDG4547653.1 NAD(P)/FAD-dependent oxidoreductase [Rickettsiales bacterium]